MPMSADHRVPSRAGLLAGALVILLMSASTFSSHHLGPARPLDDRDAPAALPSRLVNINAASADELTVLPMIGPKRAEAIIQNRIDHGPFLSIDDLQRVRGIGPGITARVRPHLIVSRSEAAPPGLD